MGKKRLRNVGWFKLAQDIHADDKGVGENDAQDVDVEEMWRGKKRGGTVAVRMSMCKQVRKRNETRREWEMTSAVQREMELYNTT